MIRASNETYCLVDVLAQAVLVSSWQLMRDDGFWFALVLHRSCFGFHWWASALICKSTPAFVWSSCFTTAFGILLILAAVWNITPASRSSWQHVQPCYALRANSNEFVAFYLGFACCFGCLRFCSCGLCRPRKPSRGPTTYNQFVLFKRAALEAASSLYCS